MCIRDSTWEREGSIKHTKAYRKYIAQRKGDEEQEGDKERRAKVIKDTSTRVMSTAERLRIKVFGKANKHNINRVTLDICYSIWNDAMPIGNGRCRKKGPLHTKCTSCVFMTGVKRTETARHTYLNCPFTMILLDTIFRLTLNETATNFNELTKWDKASVREVIDAHGLSLLTGIRPFNVTRGSKGREIDTEAYRALILSLIHISEPTRPY